MLRKTLERPYAENSSVSRRIFGGARSCAPGQVIIASPRPGIQLYTSLIPATMPAKYAHVKKRAASGLPRKPAAAKGDARKKSKALAPSPQRNPSLPLSPTTKLERAIARMLLLRYEHDIARLFSTRLFSISLIHLPTFIMRCIALGGPGWIAHNADTEDVKDFLRAAIGMDMRQAGERVATKSVLWSYTALRHFVRPPSLSYGYLLTAHLPGPIKQRPHLPETRTPFAAPTSSL